MRNSRGFSGASLSTRKEAGQVIAVLIVRMLRRRGLANCIYELDESDAYLAFEITDSLGNQTHEVFAASSCRKVSDREIQIIRIPSCLPMRHRPT